MKLLATGVLLVRLLSSFSLPTSGVAFTKVVAGPSTFRKPSYTRGEFTTMESPNLTMGRNDPLNVRGGAETALSMTPIKMVASATAAIATGLQSTNVWASLAALSGVTTAVVLPLTLYKKLWGIGVAYGFSVAAVAWTCLRVFAPTSGSVPLLLGQALLFYGVRLATYLLLRDELRGEPSAMENGTISSRAIFSVSVALFYGFLTTPLLFAMKGASIPLATSFEGVGTAGLVATGGTIMAWVGAILEGTADYQKLWVKQQHAKTKKSSNTFVGPVSGPYRISRHPNYTGEVMFWTGLLLGGAPSLGKSIPGWVCSLLGWAGIVSIMKGATARLEKRQAENYGGQMKFDEWKAKVKYPLIPFVQ